MNGPDSDHAARWLRPELVASWPWVSWLVTMMLGPGIVFGFLYGLSHSSGDFIGMMRDRFLISNGAFEASMLGLFLLVLHRRGWRPSDLRVRLGIVSTLEGVLLLIATYLGLLATFFVLLFLAAILQLLPVAQSLLPKLGALHAGMFQLSWPVIIVFTFVNAFYEELVYMSFTFNQVAAKAGPATAVATTVFIRLGIHTYQGTTHLLQIGVWALIFGLTYAFRRSVWTLIFAHACIDLISLGALKIIYD